jgi:hypothetical protein
MRRLAWIAIIFVAIIAVAWTGGWFALASWVEARIPVALDEVNDRGVNLTCERQGVVGFPFAVEVACAEVGFTEASTGSEAEVAGVTGGVSVFAPFTAAVRLQSPAEVRLPLLPGRADLQWDQAELGVGLGMSGPQDVSFEARNLTAQLSGYRVAAAAASGVLAPGGDGGTDAEVSFSGLALANPDTTLPTLDGAVSAWVSAPPWALADGLAALRPPFAVRLFDTSLSTGDSRMEVEGGVSVDAEGVLDGTVTLRLAGTEGFQAFIAALPPELQEDGNKAIGGLFLLGSPITMNGQPGSEVTIEIVRGTARVGPFERVLPRLLW